MAGRQIDGGMRAAVRPTAAQGQIHPQTQFARLIVGEPQGVEEAVGKVRKVDQPTGGVVEHHRIDGLNFHPANARFLHGPQLALELRLDYGGAEPPPAHHDAAVGRRVFEGAMQFRHGLGRGGGRAENPEQGRQDERGKKQAGSHAFYAKCARPRAQRGAVGRREGLVVDSEL